VGPPAGDGTSVTPRSALNPYVFVVGCPRSGTTLLQRMLDAHPGLAVANDAHFIPKVIRGRGQTNPPLTPELVANVATYRRFERLGLTNFHVQRAAAGAATYAAFVRGLYDELATLHGKPLAGEKTPDYVRHIPLLHTLFPKTRFLHLIRDGRDVALSVLDWARPGKGPGRLASWQRYPIATSAAWWERFVRAGLDDGRPLGAEGYLEVRYEALVSTPRETTERVASFLNLPWTEQMLAFHVGRTRTRPGRSAKKAWLPPTSGLRDWRNQMRPPDIELFEALAGGLLAELGYERAFPTISAEVAARAEQFRFEWERRGRRRSA
jgi:hypothetical protein